MRSPEDFRPLLRACARGAGRSVVSAVTGLALTLAFTGVAAASGGARPEVTHVSTFAEGHEGPAQGSTAGGTEVVIKGNNLLSRGDSCIFSEPTGGSPGEPSLPGCSDVIVYFGSEPGLVVAASKHEIDVFSPPHAAGVVDVTVTTPGGTSSKTSADHYTYLGPTPVPGSGPAPKVTAVSPDRGPASGFTTVTISGQDLLPAGTSACVECAHVTARFGSSTVPVLEGTQERLLLVSPPHDPGTVDVVVTVQGNSSATSAADRFTYTGHGGGHEHGHHHHHHHHPHHHHHRR